MKDRPFISRRQVLVSGAALATLAAAGPSLAQGGAAGEPPVILITGTSSGFGRMMAEDFARNGAHVVATMRNIDGRNAEAAGELRTLARDGLRLDLVEIDVLSDASVNEGVARAIELAGRIDVLVSNAGIVVPGPVELQGLGDFASNIETNAYGSMRMFRAVLPQMRSQERGAIIQMSSALGRAIDPMLGGYCASKLAVEAAADAMAYEIAASNVEVAVIQPAGAYPTRFQENGIRYWEEMRAGFDERQRGLLAQYKAHVEAMLAGLEPDRTLDPREVADAARNLAALEHGTRPGRVVVGPYRDGLEPVNKAHEVLQTDMMAHNPIADLLTLN